MRTIKSIIVKILPNSLLHYLFPDKVKRNYPYFLKTLDIISQKYLYLWCRDDSFMEKIIQKKGLYGEWEKESLMIWAHLSKNSKIILDIGANTGIFSILAAINNSKASVYAVEPININYRVFKRNIRKNKLSNITISKVAMSNVDGVAKMFMLRNRLNYMTSVNLDRYTNSPWLHNKPEIIEVDVPILSYPSFEKIYNFGKVDLIKIDVEEHEFEVLESMLPTIRKYKPNILVEIIGDFRAKKINELLSNLEYTIVAIHENKPSEVVSNIWDNEHHNFLFCNKSTLKNLIYLLEENKHELNT